jgi:hypothetical protein
MKNRELTRQIQIIQSLFKRTKHACGNDIEMQAHWAKYLCVLCAGFLENALIEVYSEFCNKAASEAVANFAGRSLQKIQNPKTSRFIEISAYFNNSWSEKLREFVDEYGRREAIDSIMANRHLVAHGKKSDITVARLRDYITKALEVIEFIENQCNG